nr:hypothetical protein [Tanacetum cinerariifolium]
MYPRLIVVDGWMGRSADIKDDALDGNGRHHSSRVSNLFALPYTHKVVASRTHEHDYGWLKPNRDLVEIITKRFDHQASQRYEALNDDYGELYQVHSSCKDLSERLTETKNHLVDALHSHNILSDDHKTLQQAAASYRFPATPLSDKYKKSLSDGFNQTITTGWSEGVKVERSDEDVKAILATAGDYDPKCKSTFMSVFDGIFVKRYPYVIFKTCGLKVKDPPSNPFWNVQRLGLLLLKPPGVYVSSLGHWHLDLYLTTCVLGICFVPWPLALGLIPYALPFKGYVSSFGHWHLDSSKVGNTT